VLPQQATTRTSPPEQPTPNTQARPFYGAEHAPPPPPTQRLSNRWEKEKELPAWCAPVMAGLRLSPAQGAPAQYA